MNHIEAMKQALEALEDAMTIPGAWPAGREAIATLRTSIDQAEKQDAVAWINWSALTGERRLGWECESEIASVPLYTTPPAAPVQDIEHCIWARNGNTPCPNTAAQQQWVGLTDEQIEELFQGAAGADEEVVHRFARAIEAKLREKNAA